MSDRKARTNEAFDLLKQGRDQEARAILEAIVNSDEADAAVLETLGDVREKLGDKLGALDAYAGAVTHLRARGELRRALGVVELMVLVDDTAFLPRREGAEIRFELGDAEGCWREVVAGAESALAAKDVARAVALCLDFAEALPEAAPALHIARRLEHVDKHACARLCGDLGHALRARGKNDEALALYACALDCDPALCDVLHARAGALIATGRYAEARVVIERALQQNEHDLTALGLLEKVAESLGDEAGLRAARERFDKVTRRAEHDERESPVLVPAHDDREPTAEHPVYTEDTAEHPPAPREDTEEDPTDLER